MRQIGQRCAEAVRALGGRTPGVRTLGRGAPAGCLALALFTAGCAGLRGGGPETGGGRPAAGQDAGPQAVAKRLLRDGCPGPGGSEERKVPNPHVPGLEDRVRVLHCRGMTAEIYLSPAASDPNGLPLSLEVTRPDPRIPASYDVGSSADAVVARLGPPTERTPDALRYDMDDAQSSLTFALHGGRVTAIRWEWYAD